MPQNTFDIVSQVDLPEVHNAINQAMKEIRTRYDLKATKSSIELNEKEHKVDLASLSVNRQSLEDIYLKLAGKRAAAPVREAAE